MREERGSLLYESKSNASVPRLLAVIVCCIHERLKASYIAGKYHKSGAKIFKNKSSNQMRKLIGHWL